MLLCDISCPPTSRRTSRADRRASCGCLAVGSSRCTSAPSHTEDPATTTATRRWSYSEHKRTHTLTYHIEHDHRRPPCSVNMHSHTPCPVTCTFCPSVPWHCWMGHLTRKIVSEMTYNVSSGTLNTTIPYYTMQLTSKGKATKSVQRQTDKNLNRHSPQFNCNQGHHSPDNVKFPENSTTFPGRFTALLPTICVNHTMPVRVLLSVVDWCG